MVKVARAPKEERKLLILLQALLQLWLWKQLARLKLESRVFAPASQERVTSLCSCKEK